MSVAPSLFFCLLLLLTIVPCYCILDPTSTTMAIIQANGIVCGLTADTQNRSIMCTRFLQPAESMASFPIGATMSFDSISGGPNFLCSLRSGDASFFCWNGVRERIKRVYRGPAALSQISVGSRHVAAIDGDRRKIQWWSYGCNRHALSCHHFPKSVSGEYRSLTSGDAFTCAINGNHSVRCWGPHGEPIQRRFSGMYMNTLAAGGDCMCGLNKTGHIICTKNQQNVPSGENFEFTSLAIGSNQTCAIKRKNGTAICWGPYGSYLPMGSTRFEFLVSGGNLTCGLTSDAFNVSCWRADERNSSAVIQSLPKVLPGVCVPDEASCSCGVYPDSWDLCGGSGVICKKLDTSTVESCQQFSPVIIQQPLAPSQTLWEKFLRKTGKMEYALFGVFFGVVGMFGVLLYLFRCIGKGETQNVANLPNQPDPVLPDMENVEIFTYDVLWRATNGFPNSALLGKGAFAKVFLGRLTDMRMVAVKRFKRGYRAETHDMFMSEVNTVYIGRHANVIELIGYCTERYERIIVFEHMARNNLSTHLHPRLFQQRSEIFLSWTRRVKILLDVARGLQHLQQNVEPRIIHRDIKSANILIDENWVAKIADFGMALTGPEPGSEYVEDQGPAGTRGYMDPEYQNNYARVYPRFDVYSFGVVILEVLTGRKARSTDGTMMVDTVIPIIQSGRFDDVRDKRLNAPVGGEGHALESVVEIAQQCVSVINRANFNNVVTVLESAFAQCHQAPAE